MVADRARYELRLLGMATLGPPLLVGGAIAVVALLGSVLSLSYGAGAPQTQTQARATVTRILLYGGETALPLVVGFAAAALVTQDPAKELHMALPATYGRTVAYRLALFIVWAAGIGALDSVLLAAGGYALAPQLRPLDQLTWLAPLLWCGAAGPLLALLLRSRPASVAALAMLGLAEAVFPGAFLAQDALHPFILPLTAVAPHAPDWLPNRLALLAVAGAMFLLTGPLLRRHDALLGAET